LVTLDAGAAVALGVVVAAVGFWLAGVVFLGDVVVVAFFFAGMFRSLYVILGGTKRVMSFLDREEKRVAGLWGEFAESEH